ncbi:MAG: oligosaccharide flippase family protein [Massilia sp.]|nr:oligosaccharide flippase family protein [Massilia sp.]
MANLRRSLVINFFATSGARVLQFIVSILLARILSPSEIGIYSMTVVFVNFAQVFRDFGVGNYLQREPDLDNDKIRSATGVVFTTSWLIAAVLFGASGWLGIWFKEPGIVPVMRVLAIGFVFIPFGTVTGALLNRNYAAEKQAVVHVVGTVCFCASTLILGEMGFGAMAMAYGNLINILACGIAYVPLRPKGMPWMPGFRHWKSVVHFGVGSLVTNCATTLNNSLPDILLGKLGSARHVGLFSRANSTVSIFSYVAGSTMNYGAVPYLAQTWHRGESLAPILARSTLLLTGIGWTALALTAVLGQDIVIALYGAKWLESVPAILPLALAAALTLAFNYIPMAVTAIGRPYLSAFPVAVTLATRILFGVLLYDGSLNGFAWALFLATVASAPVTTIQQSRYFGLTTGMMIRALLPSALVAAGTGAAAWVLAALLPAAIPAMARLLVMALPLAVTWYLLLRATRHELVGEVHRLAAPLKARLALLLPNV